MITIERQKEVSERALTEINRLLPQMRRNPEEQTGSLDDLEKIVKDENVALIVAKEDGSIVGMATLYLSTNFGRRSGSVEDVVVDDAYRGQGLGLKIMEYLIDVARAERVRSLHLTSSPERIAANKLYQKLGFELKETNPYTLKIK